MSSRPALSRRALAILGVIAVCLGFKPGLAAADPMSCMATRMAADDAIRAQADAVFAQLDKSTLRPWQKKALRRIWMPERDAGRFVVLPMRSSSKRMALMIPFPARLPIDVAQQTIRLARARGLSAGDTFRVYGFRVLASTAVTGVYPTLLMVVAFQGLKAVDAIGLVAHNPLLTDADPSDLRDDEVVVVVKLSRDDDPEDPASALEGGSVVAVKKQFGDRLLVVDLSGQARARGNFVSPQDLAAHLEARGLKVGKLLVVSHGLPGSVFSDGTRFVERTLEELAEKDLKPLVPHMAAGARIHSSACYLAADEMGRDQARRLAHAMLPRGGRIQVNRTMGASAHPQLTEVNRYLNVLYPMLGTAISSSVHGGTSALSAWAASEEFKTGPLHGETMQYTYEVSSKAEPGRRR